MFAPRPAPPRGYLVAAEIILDALSVEQAEQVLASVGELEEERQWGSVIEAFPPKR